MYRVLLVDDNIFDLQGVSEYIDWEALGCMLIDTAINGVEGYEKACIIRPDIIVTDVSMPYMNGVEMVEKIMSVFTDVQVIYMSCHSDFVFLKAALEQQAVSYVLKPLDINELTECVKTAVQRLEEMKRKQLDERKLRDTLRKNSGFLMEKFFCYLLSYEGEEENAITEIPLDICECLEIDLDIQRSYVLITLVMFSQDTEKNSIYQKFCLTEIGRNIDRITESDYCVGIDAKTFVMMLSGEEHSKEDVYAMANDLYSKVVEQFEEYRVLVFVSGSPVPLEKIHSEFQYQQNIINHGYFDLNTSIKVLDDSVTEQLSVTPIEVKRINRYINQVLTEEQIDIENIIDQLYPVNVLQTPAVIKATTFQILFSINRMLAERECSFKSIFGSETAVWDKLYRFETILNIKQWMKNIIISVREYLFKQDKTPYGRIVSSIEERILKQYASAQIIDDCVSALGISLGHANKVFKQCKGITIFKYLTSVRIAEAKRMLKNSDMKISEIAEKVGYPNLTYFTTFFKKITSLTPNEYRQKHRKENMSDDL